jgi:pyrrolysine biosynthesis protein PylC
LEARFGLVPPPGHVLQGYLEGPSYSIEILGRPGSYRTLQITTLEMDREHDCKRVLAPSSLPTDLARSFEETAVTLAEAVGLWGIMDVEAVLHEGRLNVLEIDARFPSQTPTAVYHSTGINMVEALARVFLPGEGREAQPTPARSPRGSILEHVRVGRGELAVCGEGIMARAGPLRLEADFFGAQEALTNYTPHLSEWVATLLVTGSDLEEAWTRRERVIAEIRGRFGLTRYRDDSPREGD